MMMIIIIAPVMEFSEAVEARDNFWL